MDVTLAPDLLDPARLPDGFADADALEAFMTRPSRALVDDLATVEGDILVLGIAGKMGPTLARLARNAAPQKRIVGVARFSEPGIREGLERHGIETIAADLLDRDRIAALPRCPNVIFMAARKFGSAGAESLTWAMNTHVPALVAEVFRESRIVAFSSGNVYPLTDVTRQGPTELSRAAPVGEYAQSCLGRERMFGHFSERYGTQGRLIRLNYAIDMRYGVLFDIATKVRDGVPIGLATGHVNVIWQGDANAQVLRSFLHCTAPTSPLNVSGPETLSVRVLATELGRRLGMAPVFEREEAPTALLTNTAEATRLFGYPLVPVARMLDWVADWVGRGGEGLGKPTKFEVRDGVF